MSDANRVHELLPGASMLHVCWSGVSVVDVDPLKRLRSMPFPWMDVSPRCRLSVMRNVQHGGVRLVTFGDVLDLGKLNISGLRNIGKGTIEEIGGYMENLGLRDEWDRS